MKRKELGMTRRNVPVYNGTLRNHSIRLPHCIRECSGIRIFGMRIKSIAFTTDVPIIRVYSSNSQCDRQRGIFALSKTFFRRNTVVFHGKCHSAVRKGTLSGCVGIWKNTPLPSYERRMEYARKISKEFAL